MAPTYENQSPASPFNLELSGDHGDHHQYHHLFNLEEPHDHQTSFSPSSLSSPMFFTPPPDHDQPQPPSQYREPQKFQFQLLEADKIASYGGSCDDQTLENEGGDNGSIVKLSISKNGAQRNGGDEMNSSSSVKWMSSKMRIMRKMTNPDQTSSSSTTTTTSSDEKPISMSHKMSSSSNNTNTTAPIIRVCSDCNTTKTPLWRSGPRGPKSLCNACGIRQRKARRAMAAAAAAANGTTLAAAMAAGGAPSMKSSSANKVVQHKENKSRVGSTVPFKKRPYKLTSSSSSSTSPASRGNKSANKKLCTFEDFTITMNTNGSSAGGGGDTTTTTTTTATTSAALHQRVFPQDEKEAAILLMALSCGLVHG